MQNQKVVTQRRMLTDRSFAFATLPHSLTDHIAHCNAMSGGDALDAFAIRSGVADTDLILVECQRSNTIGLKNSRSSQQQIRKEVTLSRFWPIGLQK
jgi:hypothetical protein